MLRFWIALAVAFHSYGTAGEPKKYGDMPSNGFLIEFVDSGEKIATAKFNFQLIFEGDVEDFVDNNSISMTPYDDDVSTMKTYFSLNSMGFVQISWSKIAITGWRSKDNRFYPIKSVKFTVGEKTPKAITPKVREIRTKS